MSRKIQRLDEIEIRRNARIKIVRTAIRLKHALAADRELSTALADDIKLFDANVAKGKALDNSIIEKLLKQ